MSAIVDAVIDNMTEEERDHLVKSVNQRISTGDLKTILYQGVALPIEQEDLEHFQLTAGQEISEEQMQEILTYMNAQVELEIMRAQVDKFVASRANGVIH